ncbi:MAG: hypothetical protein KAR35_06105 [Candidatus Heimdallarchaeota archaeon]|nr:hypothetical protein [Candidatus Heimdallarchaeota archaeon]MCK5048932.1 hypothetical protein [Candidatus Heimdallarchaeota archaeon]
MAKERKSVWEKMGPQKAIERVLPQVKDTKSIPRDAARKARLPGKRISKTGKIYWESRSSRSDKRGSNL